MKVLVDTSVWSEALRRRKRSGDTERTATLASLIEDDRVALIGPVRQELLSGIRDPGQFERLRQHLRAFPDTEIVMEDYEEASSFFNRCRAKGIQGSNTDFLICAIAVRHAFPIFTNDGDFANFAQVLPITIYEIDQ